MPSWHPRWEVSYFLELLVAWENRYIGMFFFVRERLFSLIRRLGQERWRTLEFPPNLCKNNSTTNSTLYEYNQCFENQTD